MSVLSLNSENHQQQYTHLFFFYLLLPFIEGYWLTLLYFASMDNRQQLHEEELVFNKIQWMAETLHD